MYATQLVVGAVEEGLRLGWIQDDENAVVEALKEFLRDRGRKFYKLKESSDEKHERKIVLEKKGERIQDSIKNKTGTIEVVPFRSGEEIWSLSWKLTITSPQDTISAPRASNIAPNSPIETSRFLSALSWLSHGHQPAPDKICFTLHSFHIWKRGIVVTARRSTRRWTTNPCLFQIRVLDFDPGSCWNRMGSFHPRFSQSRSGIFDPLVDGAFDFSNPLRALCLLRILPF
jgi:hypothetical protein